MQDPTTAPSSAEEVRFSLRELLADRVREAVQELLELELDETIGALRHERSQARSGYRNGHSSRRIVTEAGPIELSIPRARIAASKGGTREHRTAIVDRYQRRTRRVEEAILGCYLGGTNSRRIRKALAPLLGDTHLSKSAISRVVAKLKERFEEWSRRDLSSELVSIVYLDAMFLPVRIAKRVVRVPVQAVIGVRENGHKVLLSLRIAPSESTASWKGVVEDLDRRGSSRPKLAVVDGNKGLLRSITDTWPATKIQRCTKHKLENLLSAAPKHCHEELKRDYRDIVYADTRGDALKAYDAFVRKWSKLCEAVVTSLQEAGHALLTFYDFPKSQWKSLRTTNQIERLNGEFRRRTKTQGSFTNESSALVVLWGLVAFGHVAMRKIDGWQELPKIDALLKEAA